VKVHRPARSPQDIPQPNTARPSSGPSELSPGRAAVLILAMVALFGLGFWLFRAGDPGARTAAFVPWAATALFGAFLIWKRPRS
jgi:hypothetical protein